MQIKEIWEDLANTIAAVPSAWLLLMVVAAIAFSALSSSMVKRNLPFGMVARRISMVVLAAVLVLVVLQSSRIDTRSEISLSQIGFSEPMLRVMKPGSREHQTATIGSRLELIIFQLTF